MAYQGKAARLIAARYPQAGKTVYGGLEPEGEAMARSYRYWRARGKPAVEAVDKACLDYFKSERRWHETGLGSYQNNPSERGGRWIESPEAAGLRFIGWSDELAGLDYTGWHLEPHGMGEVARGAVYQLPSRQGRPCYVEAVRLGSDGKRGWQDQCGSRHGPAIVYLAEQHLGERGGSEYRDESAVREAARGADREADILAERERDYQEAYMAGQEAGEAEAEAVADKARARELIRELAALRRTLPAGTAPAACKALRDVIRRALQDMADSWEKARELRENYNGNEAFAEGLGNVA